MAKNIRPITGVGIKGYQVTFSILDLYKMRDLAVYLQELNKEEFDSNSPLLESTYNLFFCLFDRTIGVTKEEWDFLTSEEEESK